MTQYRKSVLAPVLALAALSALTPASADEWDKETDITFSGPVEIPGMVLPAGSYIFKLADSTSERYTVQIFREDDDNIVATVLGVPATREKATDNTVITFEERVNGAREAVHEWFYAHETDGVEFIYPKLPRPEERSAVGDPDSEAGDGADDAGETPAQSSRVEPGWPNPFHYIMVIPLPEPEPRNTAVSDVE
jgi:hypothetical protein